MEALAEYLLNTEPELPHIVCGTRGRQAVASQWYMNDRPPCTWSRWTQRNFFRAGSGSSILHAKIIRTVMGHWHAVHWSPMARRLPHNITPMLLGPNTMHTVYINVFMQLCCLRHVSNNQLFILRKTCTCSFMVLLSSIHISSQVNGS